MVLIFVFVFANSVGAAEPFNVFMGASINDYYIDEGGMIITNQNNVSFGGNIYDPSSEITKLEVNLENGTNNIVTDTDLGVVDADGYRSFDMTIIIPEDNVVYYNMSVKATDTSGIDFDVPLFDELNNIINLSGVEVDKANPYFIGDAEIYEDFFFKFFKIEISEEIKASPGDFNLFDSGSNLVNNGVEEVVIFEDGGRYFVEVKVDQEILTEGSYTLELINPVKDLAGNAIDTSGASWEFFIGNREEYREDFYVDTSLDMYFVFSSGKHHDDNTNGVDIFLNSNEASGLTITGDVHDTSTNISSLELVFSDGEITETVVLTLETDSDSDGFRKFRAENVDLSEMSAKYTVTAQSNSGEIADIGYLRADGHMVKNVVCDFESPHFISGPKINFDSAQMRVEFEINEELFIDKTYFTLYGVDGTTPVPNAINNAHSYMDGEKFILAVEIDRSAIEDYTNYNLQIGNDIEDISGNKVDASLAKMWLIEQFDSNFEISTYEYIDNQNVDVKLLNVSDNNPITITGKSFVLDESDNELVFVEFKVVFNNEYDANQDMNFHRLDGHFEDKTNLDNFVEIDENLAGLDNHVLSAIPVDVTKKNKIYLFHNEASVEFTWTTSEVNLWSHAHKITHTVSDNPVIDVVVGNLVGDPNSLALELLSQDGVTVISTLGYLEEVTTVTEVELGDGEKVYRFTYDSESSNVDFSAETMNNQNVAVKLIHDDNHDGVYEISQFLDNVRIDNRAPNPNVWFEAVETVEGVDYYVLKVNFEDNVLNSSVIASNFELTDELSQTSLLPTIVEPIGDSNDEFCWEAKLYFTEIAGNRVVVRNIEDTVGFILAEKILDFGMDTRVRGKILDKSGNQITEMQDAEIILAKEGFSAESDFDQYIEWVHIDNNGTFEKWLKPGKYKVVNILVKNEFSDRSISVEQDVEIPFSGGDETYNLDIQIPQDNVFGKVYRETGEKYKEHLLLIQNEYLDIANSVEEPLDTDGDGVISEEEKTAGGEDFIDKFEIYELFGKSVKTDEDGNFSVYLAPGTYTVVGKQLGFTYLKPVYDYTFDVLENQELDLASDEIIFPTNNVFGNVLKGENPLSHAHIAIVNQETGAFYDSMTDDVGGFEIALEDGNYIFATASMMMSETENGGMFFVNKPFIVEDMQIVLESENNPLADLALPQANLEIEVVQNGVVLEGDAGLDFEFEFAGKILDIGTHTRTGKFEFYLLPGTYMFNELFGYNKLTHDHIEIEDLNIEITIDESTDFTGENAYKIDISDLKANNSNVVITFEDEAHNPLSGYGFSVHSENMISGDYKEEWKRTDTEGKAYLDLSPGTYKIPGYDVENLGWQNLEFKFDVGEGYTVENKLDVAVTIKSPNVTGTVLDQEASPIPFAWIGLEKLPDANSGEYFNTYLGFNTDDQGAFAVNLEAGDYVINGLWNPDENVSEDKRWQEMNFKFYVVDVQGELELRLIKDGEAVTELTVQKQPDNVQGFVYKKIEDDVGVPFDGSSKYGADGTATGTDTENYNNVWLVLKESGVLVEDFNNASWMYQKWVHVETDGSFSVLVDSDKTYEAYAISTEQQYIELNQEDNPILIVPPVTDLIITPPASNFAGQVLDFDGNPIADAHVGIEKSDYSEWHGTQTDSDGYFGMSLKAGEEYVIRDVFYYDGDRQGEYDYKKEHRIMFNKKVVVGEEAEDIILRPNLKGYLDIGEINFTNDSYVSVGVRKVITENNPDYDEYLMNPWKFENWIDIKYAEGSSVGEFVGYLDDGEYEITGVNTPNGWTQLGTTFTLNQSSHDIVTYTDGTYELSINFSPNVVGTILDRTSTPIEEAWVNIEKIVEGNYKMDSTTGAYENMYFGTNTDSNGLFRLKLQDGDYRISGYSTRGYWENNKWINGKWVGVNYEFAVLDEVLQGEETIVIKPNVTGYVKKYNKSSGELETVSYAWMRVKPTDENFEVDYDNWTGDKWANSSEDGEFILMLQPGKYKVVEGGGHDLWMQLDINFEVDSDGNLVPSEAVEDGQLIIKPQKPNVRGYVKDENGNILSNSHIAIRPMEAKDHDWSNVKWIQTDDNGYFEIKLGDGQWKVTEISSRNLYQKMFIPFTVEGEEVSSKIDGVVVDGELQVKPPVSNLVGIIKDEAGNVLNEKAWLSIKPADAGNHDWENSHWLEYKEHDGEYRFKYYLEPGEYKVVNVNSRNFGYETNIKFTIGNDGLLVNSNNVENGELIIKPLQPNVVGTVYGEFDGSEQALSYGWVSIARIDSEGNQITMEGQPIDDEYEYNENGIFWNYTRGASTDEFGVFKLRLDPGLYKVMNVSGSGVWYKASTEFEVVEEEEIAIDVRQPGDNTTITVTNTGLSDTEAWIDLVYEINGYKHYMPVKMKTAQNGEYVFSARLEVGHYKIKSFGTPSHWTEIEHEFSVTDSEIQNNVSIDFNLDSKKKVTGQINQGGTDVSEKTWVAILPVVNDNVDTSVEKRWLQANSDGSFTFKLEEGSNWVVTDVTTSDGYLTTTTPLEYEITVGSDEEQTPGQWMIDINSID